MNTRTSFYLFTLFSLLFTLSVACSEKEPSDLTRNSLIPVPRSVISTGDYFSMNEGTNILIPADHTALQKIGEYTSGLFSELYGYPLEVTTKRGVFGRNRIELSLTGDSLIYGAEGYELQIEKKGILLTAAEPAGIFRGIQTLRQLLMLQEEGVTSPVIACGVIRDRPEYGYRGTMLDVARHFFDVETVKRYIDVLALYKINVLHLHLSDDQGWRIEITSWPRLTEIGGSTEVGGGPGGFYTQEQYRELVHYASERYITIVPEIDMPGHTNAALASYAELNCSGKATSLYTGTRVGFSTLCTDKEITYKFVDDVIRELAALTPGEYIHIGGDESHVTPIQDYIYFIDRVRDIVKSHGKKVMGWDEISHAGLGECDVAQYWASAENSLRAIEKGASLVISPAARCYLDMKYDSSTVIGLNWAGYVGIEEAYDWNPVALVEGIGRENIVGIESPLWSETIESFEDITYLAFPRLIGHAEIGWSSDTLLDWENYRERLAFHGRILEQSGVNYFRSGEVDWKP